MAFRPGTDYWDHWFWKFAVPALAVLALVMIALNTPDMISASRNNGLPGVYTSTDSDCNARYGCSYEGTFVSDDGTVKLDGVFIDSGGVKVGESVRAQYLKESRKKVYAVDSHDWVAALLVAAGAVAYLIGWSCLVVRPWVRRRNR